MNNFINNVGLAKNLRMKRSKAVRRHPKKRRTKKESDGMHTRSEETKQRTDQRHEETKISEDVK